MHYRALSYRFELESRSELRIWRVITLFAIFR